MEFEFASNPYFLDKVLWKEVLLESEDLPISTAVLSEAPPIKWRKDMNLTVRQVVKKAKVRHHLTFSRLEPVRKIGECSNSKSGGHT